MDGLKQGYAKLAQSYARLNKKPAQGGPDCGHDWEILEDTATNVHSSHTDALILFSDLFLTIDTSGRTGEGLFSKVNF